MTHAITRQGPAPEGHFRCAVLDDYQDAARVYGDWASLGQRISLQVFCEHMADEDRLVAALSGFQIVVLMRERTRITRSLLRRLPSLELIVTTGSRNGSIDLAACREVGVLACGTRDGGLAAAELTWALILAFERNLVRESSNLRRGAHWQSSVGRELEGRCFGVIGLGRLGGRVAAIGKAFGMDVLAWSQNLDDARCAEVGARRAATLDVLLGASDIVSIHMVLSERSKGLIDDRAFAAMKPGALLVNTSRAPIVEEAALIRALSQGRIAGVALDVFEQEPLPPDHPFATMKNVLATPHLGFVTAQTYRTYYADVVDDIRGWLAGSPIRELTQQHPAQAIASARR